MVKVSRTVIGLHRVKIQERDGHRREKRRPNVKEEGFSKGEFERRGDERGLSNLPTVP